MLKIIRKNQKKIMAVLVIFSMITFVATLAPHVASNGLTVRDAGTMNGIKFTNLDQKNAQDDWKSLKTLIYYDPNFGQNLSVAETLFLDYGPGDANYCVATIDQKPELFFILLQEARHRGFGASPDEVSDYMKNLANPPSTVDSDRAAQAIADGLTVKHLVESDLSIVKVTLPVRNYNLTIENQAISLNVATFSAADYLGKVPAPGPMDLQNQFDRLSGTLPGTFGNQNNNNPEPLGFGYEIPNRVAFQYMGVKYSDVRAAVIASQPQLDWYTDAYNYFTKNRDEIDAMAVSTTRPTTQPDALSAAIALATSRPATTEPSSTQPTTQPSTQPTVLKLDDANLDFQLHAPLVLDRLYDNAANTKIAEITREITDQFNIAFEKINNPTGGDVGDLKTKAFLEKLAANLQEKYQVPVEYGDIAQPKSADDLKTFAEPLKETIWIKNGYQAISFADYALTYAQPLMTDQLKNSGESLNALNAWQPSQVVRKILDPQVGAADAFVFRLSAIEAAHAPASLAEVRDQVLHDWKISQAYDLASKDAKALKASAEKRNLGLAAADMHVPVVTTIPFNVGQLVSDPQAKLPPLTLDHAGLSELADAGNSMLTTPSVSVHPISVADLYADATVCVIELNSAVPTWSRNDPGIAESTIIRGMRNSYYGGLLQEIFNYEDAVRRNQYQLTAPTGS